MIDWLISIDRNLFIFLNNLHSEGMDPVMFGLTGITWWIPFFLLVIAFIIYKYKWNAIYIILGIALTIAFADQFTSRFMKPFFERLRPTHDPSLENLVHIVNGYRGGLYSFASSHAANSFGVAFFLFLVVRNQIPWIWVMFIWALIFSYTRIYLGVHYPGDILVGALVGMGFGYVSYLLLRKTGKFSFY